MPLLDLAGGAGAGDLRRDLRRLTRALGPVREVDVTRAVLADLAREHDWPPTVTARLDRYLRRLRAERIEHLLDRAGRLDASTLGARIDAVLTSIDPARPNAAAEFLAPRIRRRANALASAIDETGIVYAMKPLHDVRLGTKKLRYLVELAGAATGRSVARDVQPLKRLQELLGHLHDLQVLQHGIDAVSQSSTDRLLQRRLEAMQRDVETHCRELHARYLKIVPGVRQRALQLAREATLRSAGRRATVLRMKLVADNTRVHTQ
jgi:CHAD domain-containing protein